MKEFIKKHWKIILAGLAVLGLSFYFTYQNDYFGLVSKFDKMFNQKIEQNNKEIEKLEKQITELEKENKELQKEINTVNSNISEKFIYVKSKTDEFNSQKEDIINNANDTDANIDFINECYGND